MYNYFNVNMFIILVINSSAVNCLCAESGNTLLQIALRYKDDLFLVRCNIFPPFPTFFFLNKKK